MSNSLSTTRLQMPLALVAPKVAGARRAAAARPASRKARHTSVSRQIKALAAATTGLPHRSSLEKLI